MPVKKILLRALTVAAIVLPAAGAWIWHTINTIEIHPVSGDVSVVMGVGGNVGVLKTSVGPVLVDTMTYRSQGAKIRAAVEDIGGGKVVAIINTHYHHDHTHGNTAFASTTPVLATTQTKRHLLERDGEYWQGDAASMLPSRTFDSEELLEVGDKRIRCLWLGRGHTDGDLVVLFENDRVLHTGDLFSNGRFPSIDLEAGGSIKQWIGTIDKILALDFDRVIPGHGQVSDKDGLRRFQAFLRELWAVAEKAAAEHKSLAETLRDSKLETETGIEPFHIPFVVNLDHDFVVRRAWEEARGAVPYTPPLPASAPVQSPAQTPAQAPTDLDRG